MNAPLRQRKQAAARAIVQARPHLRSAPAFRQNVAAALARWARGPRRSHNFHALCYVATAAAVAIGVTWTMADRTAALRLIMVVLLAGHMLANRLIVIGLTALRNHGMREAGRALDVYLGPDQITSVESGVIWIGIGLFAPLLDLIG